MKALSLLVLSAFLTVSCAHKKSCCKKDHCDKDRKEACCSEGSCKKDQKKS